MRLRQYIQSRVKNLHVAVTGEILPVKCKQVRKPVTFHRGDEACIVAGLPVYRIGHNNSLPRFENAAFIAQRRKESLDLLHSIFRYGGGER